MEHEGVAVRVLEPRLPAVLRKERDEVDALDIHGVVPSAYGA